MRVAVHLPNEVPTFTPTEQQILDLRGRLPELEILHLKSESELLRHLPSCDAAVVWSFPSEWYLLAPRIKHVFTPAAGRERVQPDPRGYAQTHHGSFHGQIMAESLLAMMLFMNRQLGAAVLDQRAGAWERGRCVQSVALRGQIALLIGYGAIAHHAADLLGQLGVEVHAVKRDTSRGTQGARRVFGAHELEQALRSADHVACILPGEAATSNLIDASAIAAMKPSAFLYNLGRGNAVDLSALVQALTEQRLAGAFLDVLPEEPPARDSLAFTTRNLFITPHASAIRKDYLDLFFAELAARLLKVGHSMS